MIKLYLPDLRKKAMDHPGMLQDFIDAGRLDGQDLFLDNEILDLLNSKYSGQPFTLIKLSVLNKLKDFHPLEHQHLMSAGEVSGDALRIPRDTYDTLSRQLFPSGLGNKIHDLLAPAVKLIDHLAGSDLASCNDCATRRLELNT